MLEQKDIFLFDYPMENKLVSIIVPVYNAETTLEQCILSILNQTYKNLELVLVDDGSTDNSGHICCKYMDLDHRVVYCRIPNGGPVRARVVGLELSHGDCFTFCDSDDYYSGKESIETAVRTMEDCLCDVLQFGWTHKYNHLWKKRVPQKSLIVMERQEFIRNEFPRILCNSWPAGHLSCTVWDKLYARSIINGFPFSDAFPRCFWGDDIIISRFLLGNCNRIAFSPLCIYTHRDGGGMVTWKQSTMFDLNTIKTYQESALADYQGQGKEEIKERMYSEIASWFFLHIQSGLSVLSEDEMKKYINSILNLSMFQKARHYYLEESSENWEAVALLKKANPDAYILSAKNVAQSRTMKNKLKSMIIRFLKQI